MKRIFLYSHGFATRADDNGLFRHVISFFPEVEHVLFEYDEWSEDGSSATAATFSERTRKLQAKYTELRARNPEAEIDLICHSQGCNIAALAQLPGVTKTVLLAPNVNYESGESEREQVLQKERTQLLSDGRILYRRSGGYVTYFPANYWDDCAILTDLPEKYVKLSGLTELLIIDAARDTVIPDHKDYDLLGGKIRIERLDTDHDMASDDGSHSELEKVLHEFLG